jgi:hypothetical protein
MAEEYCRREERPWINSLSSACTKFVHTHKAYPSMISMCSQSAPHCSMNFASDARFAKSDDSIEGAILGCGSIRCNSSSFPPAMVDQSIDRSIDRWISSSFDPHLLVSQTQKKRKILPRMAGFFKNPWLQKIL